MSPWLGKSVIQKKVLMLIMMRVQQQKYLSIGGVMDMNVNAFGSVRMVIHNISYSYLYKHCDVIEN